MVQAWQLLKNLSDGASEAGKLGIDISPVGGEEVLRAIDRIAAAPPDLLDYVRKLLAETRGGG